MPSHRFLTLSNLLQAQLRFVRPILNPHQVFAVAQGYVGSVLPGRVWSWNDDVTTFSVQYNRHNRLVALLQAHRSFPSLEVTLTRILPRRSGRDLRQVFRTAGTASWEPRVTVRPGSRLVSIDPSSFGMLVPTLTDCEQRLEQFFAHNGPPQLPTNRPIDPAILDFFASLYPPSPT